MKRLFTTAAVLIALTASATAQSAVTTQMAEQLTYRTQMIRDRIGIQCQRVAPAGHQRDECEMSIYTSYYKILDSIRMAQRSTSDDALKLIEQKIDEFDVKAAPQFERLER